MCHVAHPTAILGPWNEAPPSSNGGLDGQLTRLDRRLDGHHFAGRLTHHRATEDAHARKLQQRSKRTTGRVSHCFGVTPRGRDGVRQSCPPNIIGLRSIELEARNLVSAL